VKWRRTGLEADRRLLWVCRLAERAEFYAKQSEGFHEQPKSARPCPRLSVQRSGTIRPQQSLRSQAGINLVGANDLLIAAPARSLDLTLVRQRRRFRQAPS
jgi:hypothetical protein